MSIIGEIFETVVMIARAPVEIAGVIGEETCNLVEELVHIEDPSYVSSLRAKEKADEVIGSSNMMLWDAQQEFQRKVIETENTLKCNYRKKIKFLGIVDDNQVDTEKYDVSKYVTIDKPEFYLEKDYLLGKLLGPFGFEICHSVATSYLDDAYQYQCDVLTCCTHLKHYEYKLNSLNAFLEIENALIDKLMKKVFYLEETRNETVKVLLEALDSIILDENGDVSNEYYDIFNRMKRLED